MVAKFSNFAKRILLMPPNHFAITHYLIKMRLFELCLKMFVIVLFLKYSQSKDYLLKRNKRYWPLIYQNPAAITFITGFGVPVHNLNPELVTVGMVFKAQQFLPATYEALRHQANHSIHKREPKVNPIINNSRIMFYEALGQLSKSLGQAGRVCVLKMICEAAAIPFHYQNGVLGEIMHILLTPSSSLETFKQQKLYDIYLKAEHHGRNSVKYCAELYKACGASILERITNLFD